MDVRVLDLTLPYEHFSGESFQQIVRRICNLYNGGKKKRQFLFCPSRESEGIGSAWQALDICILLNPHSMS